MRLTGKLLLLAILVTVTAGVFAAPNGALESRDILSFLNQTVAWYRHVSADQQMAAETGDLAFMSDGRQIADNAVRLSFEFAKAEAPLVSRGASAEVTNQDPNSPAARYQRLMGLAAKSEEQVKQGQQELAKKKKALETADGRRRQVLQEAVAETQSEIELAQARRDAVRNLAEFIGNAGGQATGGGDLRSQIEELERTCPATMVGGTGGSTPQAAAAQAAVNVPRRVEPSGIIALVSDLVSLRRRMRSLDASVRLTDALAQSSRELRTPLVASMKNLTRRGDDIANQPESRDSAVLATQKAALDALTTDFKQLSAAVLPLGKQGILLEAYKRNLVSWRSSVDDQYSAELRNLAVRLAALAVVLGAVIAVATVWRRAIYRYVRDLRRQHQLMLVRRIVLWFVVAIIIAFAFSSELGSLATFAGLLTAGVAFALQNVILSVAGYFFLIGKYGVRVGDRVQVCGITGDVLDVGLIRLHLMEVGSDATGHPTGRVVVFSNAVVFQPNAGFFKQIPGTNFVWHEISLTLATDSDYRVVEERLLGAVQAVFADYGDSMERQRQQMAQTVRPLAIDTLGPQSRLRLTRSGLEVIIRYPVELASAAAIDDRITRELLDAIEREPKLKVVGSGTPIIQQVTDGQALTASSAGK